MEGVDYLADERKKAGFDVDEMKIVWAGSRHDFELTDRISKLVASDPVNPLTLFCFFFHQVLVFLFDPLLLDSLFGYGVAVGRYKSVLFVILLSFRIDDLSRVFRKQRIGSDKACVHWVCCCFCCCEN